MKQPISRRLATAAAVALMTAASGAIAAEPTGAGAPSPTAKRPAAAPRSSQVRLLVTIAGAELPRFAKTSGTARSALKRVAALLRAGRTQETKAAWQSLVSTEARRVSRAELEAAERWVLRQGPLAAHPLLLARAARVAKRQALARNLRAYVAELRRAQASSPSTVKEVRAGKLVTVAKRTLTGKQRDALIAQALRDKSASEEEGTLMSLDLQGALSQQQQLMQMLSNMAKVIHDTTKAAIQSVRG